MAACGCQGRQEIGSGVAAHLILERRSFQPVAIQWIFFENFMFGWGDWRRETLRVVHVQGYVGGNLAPWDNGFKDRME